MKITWLYTGSDGRSHLAGLDIPMHAVPIGAASDPMPGGRVLFRASPEGINDFHVAPMRQFVVHLTGVTEVECGDGSKARFTAGDILLADDTTGQGHVTRGIGGDRSSMQIGVPADFDVALWKV